MNSKAYVRLAIGLVLSLLIGLIIILFMEYLFFKQELERLFALQQEYRLYFAEAKRIVESQDTEVIDQADESEKKKMREDREHEKQITLIVNREPAYLRQAALAYIKEHHLECLLDRINFDDMVTYTDYLLEKSQQPTMQKATFHKSARNTKTYRPIRNKNVYKIPYNELQKTQQSTDLVLSWPIDQGLFWLSSFFGPRKKPNGAWGFHYAIDMAAVRGTKVKAALAGKIVEAGRRKGFGKTVVIEHSKKYKTRYAHLDTIWVQIGQLVEQSEVIGTVGDTGFIRKSGKDGSHLHFEVLVFSKRVNPLCYLH